MKKIYFALPLLLLASVCYGATDVDLDSNDKLDIAYGGTNSADGEILGVFVMQADCLTITAGACIDTDNGNLYTWDGDSVELSGVLNWQPLEATLTDIADGTIAENLVNTANPWADNEVADDITASSYLPLAGGTLTGTHDFGGAVVEIPNGTGGTTDATGEIYLDTNGDTTNMLGEVIQVYTGAANKYLFPIPLPLAASQDNYVMKYDAAGKTIQWEADATAGSPTFDAIGSGSNTTATMTVGTGASLAPTGDGTITATSATLAGTVAVVDSTDATSFIAMFDTATGNLAVRTDAGLPYDATTGVLSPSGGVSVPGSATGPQVASLLETSTNGSSKVGIASAASNDNDLIFALPVADPTAGQTLVWGVPGSVTYPIIGAVDTTQATWATPLTNPMDAVGDIIYGGAAGAPTKLVAVALGSVLTSKGVTTAPAWDSAPQITAVNLGHASDTTLARVSAGIASIEDVNIITGTLGATTNVIPKSSGTGTVTLQASGITEDGTDVNVGALNFVTTGYTASGVKRLGTFASPITSEGAYSLAAANAYNTLVFYNDTDECTLPAAVAGMNVCIYVPAATLVPVGPNGTDVIVLDGTALAAGAAFSVAAVSGNFVCLAADAANHWVTMGSKGTLAAL